MFKRGHWSAGPRNRFIHAIEYRASGAFDGDALGIETTQKYAAIRGIKGKEIGPSEKIGALLVFFFEGFGKLAEETGGLSFV